MKIEIKYYLDEDSYNMDVDYFRETIYGSIEYANIIAKNRLKHSIFSFYNIEVRTTNNLW